MARTLLAGLLLLLTFAISCGGAARVGQPTVVPSDDLLRGLTVGIGSRSSPAVLELRYVLQERYGLKPGLGAGSDVVLIESSSDSLMGQLKANDVGAVVLSQLGAFEALKDRRVHVLVPLAERMRELTGASVANSFLVSYSDTVEQRPAAISELNRMLEASLAYFHANSDQVINAVSPAAGREAQHWWWDHYDLPLGDLSPDVQRGILSFWQAAVALGDIDAYPELSSVLFVGGDTSATEVPKGVRQTVSLAVLDDPSRRAALYAIEQGLVTSDSIDVSISYLPTSSLNASASARQYDVVEVQPLAVPLSAYAGSKLVIISAGALDLSGTVLVAYN